MLSKINSFASTKPLKRQSYSSANNSAVPIHKTMIKILYDISYITDALFLKSFLDRSILWNYQYVTHF